MIESIFDHANRGTACLPPGGRTAERCRGRRLQAAGTGIHQEERAGGVSRMYGEPIAVTVQDDRPLRFIWRGRLYTVLVALEHWVVSREWWQRNNPDTDVPPEREFWRVEARPGGDVPPAVYELRRDTETDDWLLVRVWDLPGPEADAPGTGTRDRATGGSAR